MSSGHIFLAGAAQSEAFLHPEHIPQISLRCLLIKRTISCRATSSDYHFKKTKSRLLTPGRGSPTTRSQPTCAASLWSPHTQVFQAGTVIPDPAPLSRHLLEGPACSVLCVSQTSPDCWSPLGRGAQLSLGATPALVSQNNELTAVSTPLWAPGCNPGPGPTGAGA